MPRADGAHLSKSVSPSESKSAQSARAWTTIPIPIPIPIPSPLVGRIAVQADWIASVRIVDVLARRASSRRSILLTLEVQHI